MYEFDLPYDHKTMHLSLDEKNFAGLMPVSYTHLTLPTN